MQMCVCVCLHTRMRVVVVLSLGLLETVPFLLCCLHVQQFILYLQCDFVSSSIRNYTLTR